MRCAKAGCAILMLILSAMSAGQIKKAPNATGQPDVPGITVFGDSITCGSDASTLSLAYSYLLQFDFGSPSTIWCRSGDQAEDMARLWVYPHTNPANTRNVPVTVLIGTNNAYLYGGSGAGYASNFQNSLRASLTWLAIPSSNKILGQSAGVTKTGTWTNDNTLFSGSAIKSTVNRSTARFSITTTGQPIYIGYRAFDSNTGTATLTIDGLLQGTLNAFGAAPIATFKGETDTVFVQRYPVSAGSHPVVIAVNSSTAASNIFSFVWAGTPDYPFNPKVISPPRVFVGGVIREQSDANPTYTSTYDAYVQSVAAQLAGDGLPVTYVRARDYVNATTDMDDIVHPNDAGHGHLRDAFENAIRTNSSGFSDARNVYAPAPSRISGDSNVNALALANAQR